MRSAAIQSPFGTRTPEVVPFQVKTTSRVEIDLAEVGQLAVVGLDGARVLELELLDHVGHPAERRKLSQASTSTPRAPSSDHSAISTRAGVGGRHDADQVVGRHLQDLAGQVDRLLELGLADLGAMRAPERRIAQRLERPAGSLGAGTGRKIGIGRPNAGMAGLVIVSTLSDRCPSVGRGVPPSLLVKVRKQSNSRAGPCSRRQKRHEPQPEVTLRLPSRQTHADAGAPNI